MAGVWISGSGRRCLTHGHAGHVVARMRVGRSLAMAHRRHVTTRRHRRCGRCLAHGGHVMTGVWIGGGCRRCLTHDHAGHVVAPWHRGSLVHGHTGHIMARVWIGRGRRQAGRNGARRTDRGSGGPDPRRIGIRSAATDTAGRQRGGLRLDRRRMTGVGLTGMGLGEGRRGDEHQRQQGDGGADHEAAPSMGRTVTTLNIPACMCISR